MSKERQEVCVKFNDGDGRMFRSYELITVHEDDPILIEVRCHNPDRTLYFNKGSVKFIDIGPVKDDK